MSQIVMLTRMVGLDGETAATAAAIGMAESGGRTDAVGDVGLQTAKWGPSVGIWQIRSLNAEKGKGTARDEIANREPGANARAMLTISGGGKNWGPWSVYTNGAYKAHLPAARAALGDAKGASATDLIGDLATDPGAALDAAGQIIPDVLDPLAAVGAFLGTISDPAWWRRIGVGAAGVALIIVALVLLSRDLISKNVPAIAAAVA